MQDLRQINFHYTFHVSHDKVHGRASHDKVHGRASHDKVHGRASHDKVHGRASHDKVHGRVLYGSAVLCNDWLGHHEHQ